MKPALLLRCWLLALTSMVSQRPSLAADLDPVAQVAKAMESPTRFPWYDATKDTLKPIPVRRKMSTNWSLFDLGKLLNQPLKMLVWFLIAVAVGLIAFLIARAFLRRQARRTEPPVQPPNLDVQVEPLPFLRTRPRDDLLGRAKRAYEQGDFSEAVIYLFSYQLLELDKRSIVRLAAGKTNRQYVREAGQARSLAALLSRTMGAFEDVFFGGRRLDRRSFEDCWNRLDEFQLLLAATEA